MTWYDDLSNVREMARWMANNAATGSDVVDMIEKPWRWGWAWEHREAHDPSCSPLDCGPTRCERCHAMLPNCHVMFTESGDDDIHLCQKCRETPTGES